MTMTPDAPNAQIGMNGDIWSSDGNSYSSHQQSPAHEYGGFNFDHMPLQQHIFEQSTLPPLPVLQPQMQQLVPAPWPSLLSGQSTFNTPVYHSPPTATSPATTTPVPAPPPAPARTYVRERRTLTDEQRRKMCLFAEKNPNVKQTEIGSMFGVERSTVSKVLRNREKYLAQEDPSENHSKGARKFPDIERAVANWAKNETRNGRDVTDDQILEQVKHFARTVVNSDHQLRGINGTWLETFKQKNGLALNTRKYSSASTSTANMDNDITSPTIDPTSPLSKRDAASQDFAETEDDGRFKKLKSETPPNELSDQTRVHRPYASIGGALTKAKSSRLPRRDRSRPIAGFSSQTDLREQSRMDGMMTATFRSRSQTFPSTNGVDNSSHTSLAHVSSLSTFMTDPPLQDYEQYLVSSMPAPPRTMLPSAQADNSDMLLLPSLQHEYPTNADDSLIRDTSNQPSLDEVRQALTVVWKYVQAQQQQEQRLNREELAVMNSLMDRIKTKLR